MIRRYRRAIRAGHLSYAAQIFPAYQGALDTRARIAAGTLWIAVVVLGSYLIIMLVP